MYDMQSATGKYSSIGDLPEEEAVTYDPVQFDPEQSIGDDENDNDLLALRDAMRDICATEGRFELLL